jgi:glyceraldehyde 3-phosphate dehydrogenase
MGREALAEAMIPVIGRLYRENNVVTSIHGRSLINKSTMNILKAHRFARRVSKEELLLEETAPLLNALAGLELGAAAIDIARLNQKFKEEGAGATLEVLQAEGRGQVGRVEGLAGARAGRDLEDVHDAVAGDARRGSADAERVEGG